ncbi:DUF3797 domain-containing protein [Lysinibacillus sp. UGB7]|uniref:DUF3797 domain-containing protein n=1 Tax=Lysinibacillus sp. UGB7 TaxID=3411039 RepID=UPI003B7DDBED
MEFNQLIELQEKYATCPKCKSNRIADGKMSALENRFQRACKCGYSIEILVTDKGNLEIGEIKEPINLEMLSILESQNKTTLNEKKPIQETEETSDMIENLQDFQNTLKNSDNLTFFGEKLSSEDLCAINESIEQAVRLKQEKQLEP